MITIQQLEDYGIVSEQTIQEIKRQENNWFLIAYYEQGIINPYAVKANDIKQAQEVFKLSKVNDNKSFISRIEQITV